MGNANAYKKSLCLFNANSDMKKKNVTTIQELTVVRKNYLDNLRSECEILNLRKNDLLENNANEDRILEEKSSLGKINQQVKKGNLILLRL